MQSSLGTNDRAANRREMRRKVVKVERVTSALRDALMAYGNLDGPDAALVIVALFGVTHSKRVAPLLENLARSVQPAQKSKADCPKSGRDARRGTTGRRQCASVDLPGDPVESSFAWV